MTNYIDYIILLLNSFNYQLFSFISSDAFESRLNLHMFVRRFFKQKISWIIDFELQI